MRITALQNLPSHQSAYQQKRTRMDSKLLYPNFHAEVHRYKAASAPSASNSLKSKQQQPTRPSRATTSAGSRPNSSSSSGSGYNKETSGGSGYGVRPSSSPQKLAIQNSNNNANHHIGSSVSTRRRVLPPCVPTSAASKYAVTGTGDYVPQPLKATAKPDHHQAFTRQKSFSRIHDSDPDDEDWSSMSDDAEAPELYDSQWSDSLTQMTTQRSIASSSFSSSRQPPSRQTAIRGELELAMPTDSEGLVLSEDAASSGSTTRTDCSPARGNSNTLSPHPSSRATTPNNASSAASRFSSATAAAGGGASPLLPSPSENLQELVYVFVSSIMVPILTHPTLTRSGRSHYITALMLDPGLDTRAASSPASREGRSTASSPQQQQQQCHRRHHHYRHHLHCQRRLQRQFFTQPHLLHLSIESLTNC